MSTIQPDTPTIDRIKNLAVVGRAIKQAYSEENQDLGGDLMLAKSSLMRFKDGINRLNLSPEDKAGMMDLVEYLDKKLIRRLHGGVDPK